jgi:hypothetical protein
MSQRFEAADSRDDFPTPPWATRALVEHILGGADRVRGKTVLEPACGAGHMSKVLEEYFAEVTSSDIYPYGYGGVADFLSADFGSKTHDWVITNPPFKSAESFILKSLEIAREGVAILARTVFLESVGRYERIFSVKPPSIFAQFAERVPMVKGRLDAKASTATGYCWIVWEADHAGPPRLLWVPPCRKSLEKPGDYQAPSQSYADVNCASPQGLQSTLFMSLQLQLGQGGPYKWQENS